MPPPARRRRPAPPTASTVQVDAPVGGLNTVAAGLRLPPLDCASCWNVLAAENGLRVRYGEQEWCTGLTGSSDDGVRTLIPFQGRTDPKLWATTSSGIWDVTDSTATPTQVVAFPSPAANAGYGVFCTVVTAAGHYCLYADEENGLYRYEEAGTSWAEVGFGTGPGEVAGVYPSTIAFVTVFKGRVWMVERDTASAWYLPLGSIAGTALQFPMGTSFRNGGTLVGLWSWTYDGGAGVDDSLVALSTGGDILVFQGTDPSSASTFALRGTWFSGPPPAGRQVATSNGGELLVLTRQGVLPLSRLVVGADVTAEATTIKVANLINVLMSQRADFRGWMMIQHPEDAAFLIAVPQGSGEYPLQLAQATAGKGWFPWRGLDMACVASWEKRLYYGTTDGRVCLNTGAVDGVTLADSSSYTPVDWSVLTAATDLGTPTQKQVGLIRPIILCDGVQPSYKVEARYRYSQSEIDPVSLVSSSGETWDNALWDTAVWAGESEPWQRTSGSVGMGTAVSVAIRGSSVSRTVLVGVDVTFTRGGFL